jgi:hypothetical protein
MATWKKIVVSGSAISQLNNDSGYLISNSSGVALSGSFSGSFQGDGSGLTGVSAQVEQSLKLGAGLQGGTFNGATAVTASIDSGSLAGNGLTTSAGKFVVQNADSTISVAGGGISVVEANLTNIPNTALTNSGSIIGSTLVSLGATVTSIAGLTLTNAVATGSFTGSFGGTFTGTTNLPDLTDGNGIADFTYDGSGVASVAVEADSTTGGNVKPVSVTANGVGFDISTIDGAGIGVSGGELVVNVDDSSIEINTDALRIKAGGVTNAMLVNDSFRIGTTDIVLGATGSSVAGLTLTGVVASGSFSGSFEGDGSGLTGLATDLSISGDTGTDTVDLQNDTLDFEGTANEIVTAVTDNKVTFSLPDDVVIGQDLTVTRDLVVSRNLTVSGTASFQHTEDLDIADRFIRMASGSTSTGDGGIVIQQTSATNGEVFGFDSATTRFGVSGSFDASQNAFTPDAFMAAVVEGAANDPTAAPARYQKKGNIFVAANEDIYIYS